MQLPNSTRGRSLIPSFSYASRSLPPHHSSYHTGSFSTNSLLFHESFLGFVGIQETTLQFKIADRCKGHCRPAWYRYALSMERHVAWTTAALCPHPGLRWRKLTHTHTHPHTYIQHPATTPSNLSIRTDINICLSDRVSLTSIWIWYQESKDIHPQRPATNFHAGTRGDGKEII